MKLYTFAHKLLQRLDSDQTVDQGSNTDNIPKNTTYGGVKICATRALAATCRLVGEYVSLSLHREGTRLVE